MKSKNLLTSITIAAACFAASLVAFESMIKVPAWLQVLGRLHPLVVHFPVVLILLFICFELFLKKPFKDQPAVAAVSGWLILLSGLSAVISVIAGIILSKEAGYEEDSLNLHKWMGVAVTIFILIWIVWQENIFKVKFIHAVFSICGTALIIIAGHLGANITHGEDYILSPVKNEKNIPVVPFEDALVYNDMVRPVIQAKCVSCHNSKKAKGNLVMDTEEQLLKGGKNGKLWDLKEEDLGLLLRRVHLPLENKKHMPPAGKPQLDDDEILIISSWIKKKSDFNLHAKDLPVSDSLYMMAQKLFVSGKEEVYAFNPAEEGTVKKLNTENRVVKPIALESPALDVSFFGASLFQPKQLEDLLKIKEQVVSLNMEKIPVNNEGLKIIARFPNLRKLNLSFSNITGSGLTLLTALKNLQSLSLAGIPLTEKEVQKVCGLPNLQELYVWNTGLRDANIASLQKEFGNLAFSKGFNGDTVVLQLNPPLIQNEGRMIKDTVSVKLKHYIKGVVMHYTLDETDPDSVSSPVYDGALLLRKQGTLKVKAFKKGWFSSETVETYFFKGSYKADSAFCVIAPDPAYKGKGGKTLADLEKGDNIFSSGKWLGFNKSKMEVMLLFNEAVEASSVTISSLVDIGSHIMPAKIIKVYGGRDKNSMHLLGTVTPQQPGKPAPVFQKGIDVNFKKQPLRFIKVEAIPVSSLPSWHPNKGEKGWIFSDEIFVN